MRPASVLLLSGYAFFFGLADRPASADPLEGRFADLLGPFLSDVNDQGWSLDYNISDYRTDLVEVSSGWMSLRQGQLLNLTSWSRSGHQTVTCAGISAAFNASVSFRPLPFSYSYSVENHTEPGPTRSLTGILESLQGWLVVETGGEKIASSAEANFTLLPTWNVTSVWLAEDDRSLEPEASDAIRRTVRDDALPLLRARIEAVVDEALADNGQAAPCGPGGGVPDPSTPPATAGTSPGAAATEAELEAQLDEFIDHLLERAGEYFPSEGLEPYDMPDSEQELYQETDGWANLSGRVVGPTAASLEDDLQVLRLNDSAVVVAAVKLSDAWFDIDFEVNSELSGNFHQKMADLEGRITMVANISDPSAATITLRSFELSPSVLIPLNGLVSSGDLTTEIQTEIPDAVRGVFKKKVLPHFQAEITSKLAAALEGRTLNVSEALDETTTSTTATTTVATTSASTTSPTTSPTTAPTTAPSTASTNAPSTAPTAATSEASPGSPIDEKQTAAPAASPASTSSTSSAPAGLTSSSSPSSLASSTGSTTDQDNPASAGAPSIDLPRDWTLILSAHAAFLVAARNAL